MSFFSDNKVILLLIALGLLVYYINQDENQPVHNEGELELENAAEEDVKIEDVLDVDSTDLVNAESSAPASFGGVVPSDGVSDGHAPYDKSYNILGEEVVNGKRLKDLVNEANENKFEYNAKDFLPQDTNDKWFQTSLHNASYQVDDDNLINVNPYVTSVNTVGNSLKNASHDLRGTITNPKFSVSPWMNSSYEPDYNIKSLQ